MEILSKVLSFLPVKFAVNVAAAVVVVLLVVRGGPNERLSPLQMVGSGLEKVGIDAGWTSTAHSMLTGDSWLTCLVGAIIVLLVGTALGVATAVSWGNGVTAPSLSWGTYVAVLAAGAVSEIVGRWGLLVSLGVMAIVGLFAAKIQRECDVFVCGFCPIYTPFCVLFEFIRPRFLPRVDDYA
ncbi:hypothetical protein GCM10009551_037700 [Nocardiopsis tropica]|uniref:hypothetical protein n=1 Tax=Tsukamurella strandjordii TaxID=147577 RepID=UPI0031D01304